MRHRDATSFSVKKRRIVALLVAASLLVALPGPARAVDVKQMVIDKAKEQFWKKLEAEQPELAKELKAAGESKWTGYAADLAKGNAKKVVQDIYKEKKAELWKKAKKRAIDKGLLGPDTKTYIGWVEKYGDELLKMASKTYEGDYRGAGDVLVARMKKEVGTKLKSSTVELIDFFLKDLAGQSVGAIYFKIIEWELKAIEEFAKYSREYFGKIRVRLDSGKQEDRNWCDQYVAMREAGNSPHNAFYGQDDATDVPFSIKELLELGGYWYSTSKDNLRPDDITIMHELEQCYLQKKAKSKAAVQAIVDAARRTADTELFSTIRDEMIEEEEWTITIITQHWPSLPNDLTLVVTVVDKDTDKPIPNAKVDLGGEAKDAPQGEARYTRTLDMLLADKSAESIDVTAEAGGYDPKTMSVTMGVLANRFNVDTRQVDLRLSLTAKKKPAFDVDVTVKILDKTTGKEISGATAVFDGERKDAPNGVATFQRKSDALDPAAGERTVKVEGEAPDHEPGSTSHTLAQLSGKIDQDKHTLALEVSLEPAKKKTDEVSRLVVDCSPAEIEADESSACSATAHLKSGNTKDVTADSKWTPDPVERSKGTVNGSDFAPGQTLPRTVAVEATWEAPLEHGAKSVVGGDSVVIKAKTVATKPAIKIAASPDRDLVSKGDTVTYGYNVSNAGNAPLSKVSVAHDACSPLSSSGGDSNGDGVLDLGETWSWACDAIVNADTASTATANGTAPDGSKVSDAAKIAVKIGTPPPGKCPAPKVVVPDVRGTKEPDAMTTLRKESLQSSVAARQLDDTTDEGTVLDQEPRSPACVDPNSMVELWISQKPKKDDDKDPNKKDDDDKKPGGGDDHGVLDFDVDCGKAFEIAQGDFLGRTCHITVRGWRSNTEDRVEVKIEYERDSGIEVSPGDTSAPPSLMYTAGVDDHHGTYVFSETFRATDQADPGTTTVAISVSQPGRKTVSKLVSVAVLRKGLLPSNGAGIRPPADVKPGSGGEFCVWRYKLVGDPAPCFHFVAAGCDTDRYTNPRNGYELVGSNMKWSEADERVEELSSYFDDKYGCRAAGGGITDTDGDGKADNEDGCPTNPDKQAPGQCGCSQPDTDTDEDGTADCNDGCSDDADKTEPGLCGCGVSDDDTDGDDTPNCKDECPEDSGKTAPGKCDCGYPDDDTDKDGALDCEEDCDRDPDKTEAGQCGCGEPEDDADGDRWPDCIDECPQDGDKVEPGECGCGEPDTDSDGDREPDCNDECPRDPDRTESPCAGDDEEDDRGSRPGAGGTAAGADDEEDDDADRKPKPIDPTIGDRIRDRDADRDARDRDRRTTDAFKPPDDDEPDIGDVIDKIMDDVPDPDDEDEEDEHDHAPAPATPAAPASPPPAAPAPPPSAGGLTDVTVGVTPTTMLVWDSSVEDKDMVAIDLNGQVVQAALTIRTAKQSVILHLKPGPNTVVVRALNIGDPQIQIDQQLLPLNSAAVSIQGVNVGRSEQSWQLAAGETGSMTITYTPPPPP